MVEIYSTPYQSWQLQPRQFRLHPKLLTNVTNMSNTICKLALIPDILQEPSNPLPR